MRRLTRELSKFAAVTVLAANPLLFGATTPAKGTAWSTWSSELFDRATKEHRFVLLSLESGGCEDCRDMNTDTYTDESVQAVLAKKYIPVRVDINARPDLANRYWDYQLPGIVIFNSDGSEIIRQQGYIPPKGMASLLQAVIDDPSPGPSVKPEPNLQYSSSPSIASSLLRDVQKSLDTQYNIPAQGWAFAVQYLDSEFVSYVLTNSGGTNRIDANRLRLAISRSRQLIDPMWGGVYESLVVPVVGEGKDQHSEFLRVQISGRLDTMGDSWNTPRYEKSSSAQAQAIEIYASAYQRWHDHEDLTAALNVAGYVDRYLRSRDGAFYTGQAGYVNGATADAAFFAQDDRGRRAIGVPPVDMNIYARQNGQMIRAFCALYQATGERRFLDEAERSTRWVMQHRALRGGGFSHGDHDSGGPYLVDSVEMGRAFLALFVATHDAAWLKRAEAVSAFIETTFVRSDSAIPGVPASASQTDPLYKPHTNREENVDLMCFIADLAKLTGKHGFQNVADSAMRYLVTKEVATANFSAPLLLAISRYTDFVTGQSAAATRTPPQGSVHQQVDGGTLRAQSLPASSQGR